MSDWDRILALILIAFAVLSVPLGLSLAAILGWSTLVGVLRFIEGGLRADAVNAAITGVLFIIVSMGVLKVVRWLRK
ncbi:hypothetical protein JXL21_03375 [Candidatus Bathyarchaeota archaeon]|nr:hypothetical protein [Candidatus Bathyarchaeota archaeon]